MDYATFLVVLFFLGVFILAILPTLLINLSEKYFSKSKPMSYYGETAKDEQLNEEIIGNKAVLDGLRRV